MTYQYVDSDDCQILPDNTLMDCDGDVITKFPKGWKNDQIWFTLGLINRFYAYGVECGERNKASEIRKALMIEENPK